MRHNFKGEVKSGALTGAGRQISHSHRSRTWHRAAYRSLLDARPLLSGHLHTLCSCSGEQQPCPWEETVTLGGNGKRGGHVRVPPEDRGSCTVVCTYKQGVRRLFSFPFLQGFWRIQHAQQLFQGPLNEL